MIIPALRPPISGIVVNHHCPPFGTDHNNWISHGFDSVDGDPAGLDGLDGLDIALRPLEPGFLAFLYTPIRDFDVTDIRDGGDVRQSIARFVGFYHLGVPGMDLLLERTIRFLGNGRSTQ